MKQRREEHPEDFEFIAAKIKETGGIRSKDLMAFRPGMTRDVATRRIAWSVSSGLVPPLRYNERLARFEPKEKI